MFDTSRATAVYLPRAGDRHDSENDSVSSLRSTLFWYAAVKNGINVLTTALSKEVAEDGIRVNAISPGPIHTDANDPAAHPERLAWIPMKRYGQPSEVAEAALFLTSPAASFITGVILNVSGGR